jgi:hypothetical protein
MPSTVAQVLATAGITAHEFPTILARDPPAFGLPFDSQRYAAVNTTFPYEPPLTATDPVPTVSTTISDSSTQSNGIETVDTYQVSLSAHADEDFLDFEKATLKDTLTWQWTNKSSSSLSSSSTQIASATIGGPGYGYNGPTVIKVYEDTIYHTFEFELQPLNMQEIALQGKVLNSQGEPLPYAEISLRTLSQVYKTFSNSKGVYAFYGHITEPGILTSGGKSLTVGQVGAGRLIDFR